MQKKGKKQNFFLKQTQNFLFFENTEKNTKSYTSKHWGHSQTALLVTQVQSK